MITDGKASPIKPIITIGFVPFTKSYSIMVIFNWLRITELELGPHLNDRRSESGN